MTTGQAVAAVRDRLAVAGVPTPDVDAELLVRQVTGYTRAELLARAGDELAEPALDEVWALTRRRAAREPLQLVIGTVGFRHLEVAVRSGVFVPRPETEVLAGLAIERTPAGGVVVEPGTGTGAVACSVAFEAEPGRVVATDVSAEAVDLARVNAERCGVRVEVVQGDLTRPVDPGLRGRVDVLVSNPPYLAAGELAATEPEVRDWDPAAALVAGPTGHEVSDRLITAAGEWLRAGGWLLLEVDEARAANVAERCRRRGLADATVVRDLTGRDRIVTARRL